MPDQPSEKPGRNALRIVFVVLAVAGAASACGLCLPLSGWALVSPSGSPTWEQYVWFALANVLIGSVGSMPGVLPLFWLASRSRS